MFDFDVRSGLHDGAASAGLTRISFSPCHISSLRHEFSELVGRIPRRPPLVVGPSVLASAALELMAAGPSQAVLVGSHGVLLGMLSGLDVVRRMLDSQTLDSRTCPGDVPVSHLMDPRPGTLLEHDSIGYAIRKLETLGGRPMPVLHESGALSGVLAIEDVVAWLCGGRVSDPKRPDQGKIARAGQSASTGGDEKHA